MLAAVLMSAWAWQLFEIVSATRAFPATSLDEDSVALKEFHIENKSFEDPSTTNDFALHDLTENKMLNLIQTYFSFRNIHDLNIYVCSLSEAAKISKLLIQGDFKIHVKPEFRNVPSKDYRVIGNFVDLSCVKNNDRFKKVTRVEGVWLLWGVDTWRRLRLDSDVVLGTRDGLLWDLHEEQVPAGFWEPPYPRLPDRTKRFELGGITLRGVYLALEIKYSEENKTEEITNHFFHPNKETAERFTFVLFQVLAKFYNFRLEVLDADTWGLELPNGSFSGMIGLIERKSADLGIAGCEMREERFRVVHFLPCLQKIRFIYLFLEERALGTYKALIIPFNSSVWFCTLVMIIFAGTLLGIMYKGDFFNWIVFVIGIFAQQGLSVEADRTSARLLSSCLLLLGLILYSYYNAAIMNGLLSPSPTTIHNAKELKKSPLRIGIANIPYLNFAFNQKKYIPGEMLSHIQSYPNWFVNISDGLEKVRRERFCLCSDDISLYPEIEERYTDDQKCKIREFNIIRPFPLSIPLPQDSSYREMFTQGFIRLQENGIAHRERKRWYPEKSHCLGATVFTHVSLEAVSVALFCLAIGAVASIVICAFEIILNKKFNKVM